jgi:hypothetical protein
VEPLGPPDPSRLIAAHLRDGEDLLWAGRPDPSVHLTAADLYLIPFSIFWIGFSLFWEKTALDDAAPIPFALFGVPFIGMGVYVTVGRFFVKRRQKQRTVYGLTDKRAIVLEGDRNLRDGPVRDQPTSVRRSRDGMHVSVTFGVVPTRSWPNNNPSVPNTGMDLFDRGPRPLAFFDVEHPQSLLDAVERAAG